MSDPKTPADDKPFRLLLGILVPTTVVAILYEILFAHRLDRSAAMFLGVPLVLGWLVAVLCRRGGPIARVFARTFLVLAIVLVVLAPFLREGVICIVMASPIVILLALFGAWLHYRTNRNNKVMSVIALAPFLYSAIFYPSPKDLPRRESAFEMVFEVPTATVWKTFTEDFRLPLGEDLPAFLKMGFPKPLLITGRGEAVGDRRRILFDTGEILGEVVAVDPGRKMTLKLSTPWSHGEFFDRWVYLDEMTIELQELPGNRTRYTHVARYRNRLLPSLYFLPIEQYSAQRVEKYLAEEFHRYLLSRQ